MSTEPHLDTGAEVFLGPSASAARLRLQVARFAPHFRTVLLVGEPGSGKHTVAAELHRLSPATGPFLALAGPADLTETALPPDSTIYLPALEGVRLPAQEDLLASLKATAREGRVIIGCAGDPRGLVAAGRLRPDVLDRLGTLEIRIPALRDRPEDLPAIASAMLVRLRSMHPLLPAHAQTLHAQPWPANLRELWEACSTLAATGELSLTAGTPHPAESPLRLDDVMRLHVRTVIERCAGNKLRAAELLGISRSTLYRMMDAATQNDL